MSNPFERLRALARWSGDDDGLAVEAAGAIARLAGEPGMVVACRRMLAHHPANGRLWWLLAHVLASPDPRAAAKRCEELLDADVTGSRLAGALPLQDEGQRLGVVGWTRAVDVAVAERFDLDVVAIAVEGDDPTGAVRARTTDRPIRVIEPWEAATHEVAHVLVSAIALDDRHALVPGGVADLAWEIGDAPIWIVAGVGAVLPRALVDAIEAAATASESDDRAPIEQLALDRVERVVGPRGAEVPTEAVMGFDCPLPAELLRPF